MAVTCGQKLLHDLGLVQASCFSASEFPIEKRLEWSDSFSKNNFRNQKNKLKNSSLFLVLSQNCDIACHDDRLDSAIEIVVCKKIREKDVFAGNMFVKSVRKLHFQEKGEWYEANADYILTIDKADLLEAIINKPDFQLSILSDNYAKAVPAWRSNRYLRAALPDAFNEKFSPFLEKYLQNIEEITKRDDGSSFIRAIYIKVDPLTESDKYSFEIFALMWGSVDNDILSETQNEIEELAMSLDEIPGFEDVSEMYADRDQNTSISYLDDFVRVNLDYRSLSNEDNEIGPTHPN